MSSAAAFDGNALAPKAQRQAFFIPSVFGVEPHLLDLCDLLAAHVRLDLVSLPDAGTKGGVLTDMRATARGVADEIVQRQPQGPISLVGYSFGASVALEVATQLEAVGRKIAFLGILDGPFIPPDVEGLGAPQRSAPRRIVKDVAVEATQSLDLLRRLVFPPGPTGSEKSQALRRAVLWHLRNKALVAWEPGGCKAPGLHVSTGAYGPDNRRHWAELCPNLVHVEIPSPHERLLHDASLIAVASAIVDASSEILPA